MASTFNSQTKEAGGSLHRPQTSRQGKSPPDLAAQFIVDVNLDDLVHRALGLEAQRQRPPGVEIARPAGDDADDGFVRHVLDQASYLVARDAAQCLDLLAHRGRKAR